MAKVRRAKVKCSSACKSRPGKGRCEWEARATAVLMSVLHAARQQNRPLFETIKTLLMNAWAGMNPGLLADVLVDSS